MQTVIEAGERFIFHCKFEKGLSIKTIQSYSSDIKQFIEFLKTKDYPISIEFIEKTILKDYLQSISERKPKTIKRKIATLKALFNFLEFEDEVLINPFRKMRVQIKESKILPKVLNLTEIHKIFKVMYKEKAELIDLDQYAYKAIIRDIAIIELLFATGIRVSELCHLKVKNIDKRYGSILVQGKGDKERRIQICNQESVISLKEYYNIFKVTIERTGYFFINRLNRPLSDQSVRYMIRKYSILAGIEKEITPHTFRHTFATLLLEEGVDIIYIQQLLGHSSIMTTQIYTHVNQLKQKQILQSKHPRKKFNLMAVV